MQDPAPLTSLQVGTPQGPAPATLSGLLTSRKTPVPSRPPSETSNTKTMGQTENIMPQLLGSEDDQFVTEFQEIPNNSITDTQLSRNAETPTSCHVKPQIKPASASELGKSTTEPSHSKLITDCFKTLTDLLIKHNKNITDELDKNTRSVRFMEKAIIAHTEVINNQIEAMNNLTETIKDLNQTMINNAREERRREDDRKRRTEEKIDSTEKKKRIEERENNESSPKSKPTLGRPLQNRTNRKQ